MRSDKKFAKIRIVPGCASVFGCLFGRRPSAWSGQGQVNFRFFHRFGRKFAGVRSISCGSVHHRGTRTGKPCGHVVHVDLYLVQTILKVIPEATWICSATRLHTGARHTVSSAREGPPAQGHRCRFRSHLISRQHHSQKTQQQWREIRSYPAAIPCPAPPKKFRCSRFCSRRNIARSN